MAEETAEPKKLPQRNYGKVIISLENCIFDREKLKTTASKVDGLDLNTEISLRILGCEYIQTAGILLRLPQVAMATAQVLFQRFYYSKSFVKHNMEIVSMACINVASKIEEAPRRLRDVVNVFYHIKQKSMNKPIEPMILDGKYITLKNNVIKAERRVLKELGFSVHVKHPHKMIVMYLQQLELQSNKRLVQTAWTCGKYGYTLALKTPLRTSGGSSWCTQLNVLPFHPHLLLMVPPDVFLKILHPISQMSLLTNKIQSRC